MCIKLGNENVWVLFLVCLLDVVLVLIKKLIYIYVMEVYIYYC